MSFYSALTASLHKVQDARGKGSVASDYPLQTSADFGNLYWATVSLLSKDSLLDYVTHTCEGDKCQFLFKHDSWFADTDTNMSVSANVKLSLVEGKGVSVVAIFGLSGLHGFTDTIRGYVANGDLANVIASWFKALSYDGKARSYYIDAWDDFSTALSNISEHPGFTSAVEDAAASQSLEYPFKGARLRFVNKAGVADAASTASSMEGMTPIESSFGGSALYRVLLWPGQGYHRDVFYVRADSEESALEALSTYLIKEGLTSYYYTEDEYADYLSRAGISEEEDTSYIYIDGTMEGAPYPIHLLSENMRIEEV